MELALNKNNHETENNNAAWLLFWGAASQLILVLSGYGMAYGIEGEFGLGVTSISLTDAYQLFWIIIARIANNPDAINVAWVAITQRYFQVIFTWGFAVTFIAVILIARYSNRISLANDGQAENIFTRVKKYLKVDWKRDRNEKWFASIKRAFARTTALLVAAFLTLSTVNFLLLALPLIVALFSAIGVLAGSGYVSEIRKLPTCEIQKQKIELPLDQSLNAQCEKIWQGTSLVAAGRHVLTLGDVEFIFDAKDNSPTKIIFKNADYKITPY